MTRPMENLSARQRRLTPLPFCRYLVNRVREMFGVTRVAVLWTEPRSLYWLLWPEVELWGRHKNANTYGGPWPVICHPPCGPWGKYRKNCFHRKDDAIRAMELVHRWGGIVEHPVGSSLFRQHGTFGTVERLNQGDFGHEALKPTLLYVVRSPLRN